MVIDYDALSAEIYASNVKVGWWDDPDECLFQKLQLACTEVAEATEGARKNLMDTHLVHRAMEEVEYADCMIRILDIGGRLKLTYTTAAKFHHFCLITNSVGHQQLGITAAIVDMAETLRYTSSEDHDQDLNTVLLHIDYSRVINSIVQVASNRGCNLFTAIEEKREFNAQRPDHKRENREKDNGKKF